MSIEILEGGRATATVDLTPEHHNPYGVTHGGVLFTMVDTAMGGATTSVLAPDEICASIEIHIRFLRSVREGRVRAHTEVVHRGRRIVHLESRVEDAEGRLVATATGSFAVIPAPA